VVSPSVLETKKGSRVMVGDDDEAAKVVGVGVE
jgi:hypothetical protein